MFGDVQIIHGLNASLVAAATSTAGILSVAAFGALAQRRSHYFSAFAVGLLTVSVFLHLLLEAYSLSSNALSWVAGGFTLMVLIGITVQLSVSRRAEGAALTFGYASIIALAAHSFLDGIIYSSVFQAEPFTGWLTIGGLLFHEFPEGVIAYFLLAEAGLGRLRSIILAFLAAAFTTIAGTVGGNILIEFANGIPLAAMLGGAAGALLYVLIFHLGPHAAKAEGRGGYFFAAFGVVIGAAAVIINVLNGGH